MTTSHLSNGVRLLLAAACAITTASCGSDLLRTGRSPMFLTIMALEGSKGSSPDDFVANMQSDVQTIVDDVPTIFNDVGRATLRADAKDQGGALGGTPAPTTPLNNITITRYRVNFRRADGRNTPGVDVPFGFDGAATVTLTPGGTAEVVFDLVRHAHKSEPPLRNLVAGGGVRFISTVAEITFFGRDQNGNEVTVSGMMDVTFADFGDEE